MLRCTSRSSTASSSWSLVRTRRALASAPHSSSHSSESSSWSSSTATETTPTTSQPPSLVQLHQLEVLRRLRATANSAGSVLNGAIDPPPIRDARPQLTSLLNPAPAIASSSQPSPPSQATAQQMQMQIQSHPLFMHSQQVRQQLQLGLSRFQSNTDNDKVTEAIQRSAFPQKEISSPFNSTTTTTTSSIGTSTLSSGESKKENSNAFKPPPLASSQSPPWKQLPPQDLRSFVQSRKGTSKSRRERAPPTPAELLYRTLKSQMIPSRRTAGLELRSLLLSLMGEERAKNVRRISMQEELQLPISLVLSVNPYPHVLSYLLDSTKPLLCINDLRQLPPEVWDNIDLLLEIFNVSSRMQSAVILVFFKQHLGYDLNSDDFKMILRCMFDPNIVFVKRTDSDEKSSSRSYSSKQHEDLHAVDLLPRIVNCMKSLDVLDDPSLIVLLMRSYARNNNLECSVVLYDYLMHADFRPIHDDIALEKVQELAISALFDCFGISKRGDLIAEHFIKLESTGIQLTPSVFDHILRAYLDMGDTENVARLISFLVEKGIPIRNSALKRIESMSQDSKVDNDEPDAAGDKEKNSKSKSRSNKKELDDGNKTHSGDDKRAKNANQTQDRINPSTQKDQNENVVIESKTAAGSEMISSTTSEEIARKIIEMRDIDATTERSTLDLEEKNMRLFEEVEQEEQEAIGENLIEEEGVKSNEDEDVVVTGLESSDMQSSSEHQEVKRLSDARNQPEQRHLSMANDDRPLSAAIVINNKPKLSSNEIFTVSLPSSSSQPSSTSSSSPYISLTSSSATSASPAPLSLPPSTSPAPLRSPPSISPSPSPAPLSLSSPQSISTPISTPSSMPPSTSPSAPKDSVHENQNIIQEEKSASTNRDDFSSFGWGQPIPASEIDAVAKAAEKAVSEKSGSLVKNAINNTSPQISIDTAPQSNEKEKDDTATNFENRYDTRSSENTDSTVADTQLQLQKHSRKLLAVKDKDRIHSMRIRQFIDDCISRTYYKLARRDKANFLTLLANNNNAFILTIHNNIKNDDDNDGIFIHNSQLSSESSTPNNDTPANKKSAAISKDHGENSHHNSSITGALRVASDKNPLLAAGRFDRISLSILHNRFNKIPKKAIFGIQDRSFRKEVLDIQRAIIRSNVPKNASRRSNEEKKNSAAEAEAAVAGEASLSSSAADVKSLAPAYLDSNVPQLMSILQSREDDLHLLVQQEDIDVDARLAYGLKRVIKRITDNTMQVISLDASALRNLRQEI